jgi:DNA-binding CsgD family transcriptional regulator
MGLSENTVKKYVYRNVRRFAMQKITAQMSMTHAV